MTKVLQRGRLAIALPAVLAGFSACTARRSDHEMDDAVSGDASFLDAPALLPAPPATAAPDRAPPGRGQATGPPPVLAVPRAAVPILPTGHFNVKVWSSAVNTHTLLDSDGEGAVPVSEARFLWGDGKLYFFFYAGDLDLQIRNKKHDGPVWKDDSVVLSFFMADGTKRVIQVSPTGVVADGICPRDTDTLEDPHCDLKWESGARVGTDYDGTINKLGDFDEEWAVEAAVPLRAIGWDGARVPTGTQISFSVRRCEVAFDGPRACGVWGTNEHPGQLILEP